MRVDETDSSSINFLMGEFCCCSLPRLMQKEASSLSIKIVNLACAISKIELFSNIVVCKIIKPGAKIQIFNFYYSTAKI